jgi:hypothetical protein
MAVMGVIATSTGQGTVSILKETTAGSANSGGALNGDVIIGSRIGMTGGETAGKTGDVVTRDNTTYAPIGRGFDVRPVVVTSTYGS